MRAARLAQHAVLAASALACAGCLCSALGGKFCSAADPRAKTAATHDYRYELSADGSGCGGVQMRVAEGDGAAKHPEVAATLFDYLELHAKTPEPGDRWSEAPRISLWLRRGNEDTFYGYVVDLKKGAITEAHLACDGKPRVGAVEYKE